MRCLYLLDNQFTEKLNFIKKILISESRKYIKEGRKAAPHTGSIQSNHKAKKTQTGTPHQPLGDRYPLQEAYK